jgi:hypothetical protein
MPRRSRRLQKDRLDDHWDDHPPSDAHSDGSKQTATALGFGGGVLDQRRRTALAPGVLLLVPEQIRWNLPVGTGDRWLDDQPTLKGSPMGSRAHVCMEGREQSYGGVAALVVLDLELQPGSPN